MKTTRLLVLLFAATFLLQGCHWFHHRHGHGHRYAYSYDGGYQSGYRHNDGYHGSIRFRIPHVDVIIR